MYIRGFTRPLFCLTQKEEAANHKNQAVNLHKKGRIPRATKKNFSCCLYCNNYQSFVGTGPRRWIVEKRLAGNAPDHAEPAVDNRSGWMGIGQDGCMDIGRGGRVDAADRERPDAVGNGRGAAGERRGLTGKDVTPTLQDRQWRRLCQSPRLFLQTRAGIRENDPHSPAVQARLPGGM